jgi:hypothetical protein
MHISNVYESHMQFKIIGIRVILNFDNLSFGTFIHFNKILRKKQIGIRKFRILSTFLKVSQWKCLFHSIILGLLNLYMDSFFPF